MMSEARKFSGQVLDATENSAESQAAGDAKQVLWFITPKAFSELLKVSTEYQMLMVTKVTRSMRLVIENLIVPGR
ncbi:hypothetical protein ACH5RR_023423 [Cinchona calisaya]|uniref:Uncharacterized protein n=1 Tax=Cinchona calisaya TaxID=153742 RepID=A0ABD2ZCI6_9GENT